jgi:hypothetical protein
MESKPELIIVVVIIILLMTSVNTLLHWDELDIVFRKCLCQLRVKHYYKELDKPFLHACDDENMIKGENLVTIDLTSFEVLIYSFTYYFHVECACEKKLQKENKKYQEKKTIQDWDSFISKKVDDDSDEGEDDENSSTGDIEDGKSSSSPLNRSRVAPDTIEENKPFQSDKREDYIPLSALSHDSIMDKKQMDFLRPSPLSIHNPNGEQLSFSVRKTTKILPNGTTIIDEEQVYKPSPIAEKKSFSKSFLFNPGDGRAALSWFFHSTPHVHSRHKQLTKDHDFFCQHVNIAIDSIKKMVKDHKAQLNQYNPLVHLSNNSDYVYQGSCDNRLCYRCNTRLNRSIFPELFLNISFFSLFSFKKNPTKKGKKEGKKIYEEPKET